MTYASGASRRGNPLFELQQAIYASANYTRRRLHQTRFHWVAAALARHGQGTGRAIEYGPGSGIYLPVLGRLAGEVVAADVEQAYLREMESVRERVPNLRLVQDDIEASRFAPGTFDLVLCSEVLEHVPDPEAALHTLYRILRPGGTAVVTTPQRYSLMELCCKVAFLPGVIQGVRWVYREPILPTGHISLRSGPALRRAIEACGFEVVEQARFGLYVPVVAELGKDRGGRAIEWLERHLAGTALDALFWTQAYVLRKP